MGENDLMLMAMDAAVVSSTVSVCNRDRLFMVIGYHSILVLRLHLTALAYIWLQNRVVLQ